MKHAPHRKRLLVISGMLVLIGAVGAFLFSALMSRQDIVLIPLDSRPVNTQYAEMLGEIGNATVRLPPADLLDSYLKPAPVGELMTWLETNSAPADKIIICTNELINGGLIASRAPASYREAEKRMARLEEYLAANASKDITVLFILPRHLPSQFTELWEYRDDLTRWGEISDRLGRGDLNEPDQVKLQAELARLEKDIPPGILAAYTGLYGAAHEMGQNLVRLAGDGLIDQLVIGLDDTAPYGLSIQIFNALKDGVATSEATREEVKAGSGSERIAFLHGADDLTMLVLAKELGCSWRKPVFDVVWLNPGDEAAVFPFEGIPAGQMLAERIAYLGGKIEAGGRLKVFIHSRPWPAGNDEAGELLNKIAGSKSNDAITGLADIAYTNRADTGLLAALGGNNLYGAVDAYAGWNTAGNSLGTVLAHTVLLDVLEQRFAGNKKGLAVHREFQAVRMIEDYIYQGLIREKFNDWAERDGLDTNDFGPRWDEANRKLQELMAPALGELSYGGYSAVFPWPRSFEIRVIPRRDRQSPIIRYSLADIRYPNIPDYPISDPRVYSIERNLFRKSVIGKRTTRRMRYNGFWKPSPRTS